MSNNAVIVTEPAATKAPADASYVVIGANSTLTDERILTGTSNQITVTDGGAGNPVTLSLPQNIHTGATPQFAGASLISGQTTIQPAANSYNTKIAYVYDEATTNLITNPNPEIDTTGWSVSGAGASFARSTSQAWIGSASLRFQVNPGNNSATLDFASIPVTAGVTYVFSCYIRSATGTVEDYNPSTNRESFQLRAVGNVSGGTVLFTGITVKDEWVRAWGPWTAGGSDTSVTFRLNPNNTPVIVADWYVGAAMVEQKSATTNLSQYGWPTTYCDGAMGSGHSWSGTAFASTSSRAAGAHYLAPYSSNSVSGIAYKTDGTWASSHLQYVNDRAPASGGGFYSSSGDEGTIFLYDFVSRQATGTGLGSAEGTMRVYNRDNGVALWVKSNAFTNNAFGYDENVIVVEGPNIRNGSILAVAAPTDLTNFSGFYMRFFDKSNRDMFTVKRDTLNYGNVALGYTKTFKLIGGGAYSETLGSNLTGTIATTSGSTTFNGTGTLFTTELAIGDVIKLSGISTAFVVEAIGGIGTLTVTTAPTSTTSGNTYARYSTQYGPLCMSLTQPRGDHKGIAKGGPDSCLFNTNADLLRFIQTPFVTGSGTLTMTATSGTVTTSVANSGIAVGDWIHAPGQTARAAGQAPMQVIRVDTTSSFRVRPAATASWVTASGNWYYQKTAQSTMPTDGSSGYSIHSTIAVSNSDSGPSASTTETSLFSTLPVIRAATFQTNRPVRIKAYGTLSGANAGKTLTLRVKLGSTTILTTHAEVIADISTNNWTLEIIIAPDNSQTAQKTSLIFECQSPTTSVIDTIIDYETSAVDTTADQALDVTAQWGVANSTLTANYKIVEVL